MKGVVPFEVVGAVVCYELLEGVVLLVFVGVVRLVADLLAFDTVLPLPIESAYGDMVLMSNRPLESAVERFGIFFLGVLRGAEVHEGEGYTGAEEAVLVLAHEVLLYLDAGRHAPTVALYQPEHVPEAVHHKDVLTSAELKAESLAKKLLNGLIE